MERRFGAAIAVPGKSPLAVAGRVADPYEKPDGPAEYYQFPGFPGRIGFISPISHKFCRECNRVRLTCEGRLKLCLHYDRGLELKPLLRSGALDEEIRERILAAVREKPSEHHFREKAADGGRTDGAEEQRKMVQIGG